MILLYGSITRKSKIQPVVASYVKHVLTMFVIGKYYLKTHSSVQYSVPIFLQNDLPILNCLLEIVHFGFFNTTNLTYYQFLPYDNQQQNSHGGHKTYAEIIVIKLRPIMLYFEIGVTYTTGLVVLYFLPHNFVREL